MSGLGRNILLAEQQPTFDQTGIDFVAVDVADQARVYVYFVIDPLDPGLAFAANELDVDCQGVATRTPRIVEAQAFEAHVDAQGRTRNVLAVTFDSGASFEMQRLRLSDLAGQRLDPFSATALFSFKQACPTVFDCACYGTPEDVPKVDYPVDYLARDFESYLDAFATFSRDRYPEWQMNIVPDQARMLGDVIAAIGDELAFIQDGYRLETQFEHLKERRSFDQLTRILNYRLRPELPARGEVVLRHYEGMSRPVGLAAASQSVDAGTALSGFGDSDMVIPFEVGATFDDILTGTSYPTNALWTDLPVHIPDETCPWIARGARELTVRGTDLIHPDIGPGSRILIDTRPTDQSEPLRRVIVTLDRDPELVVDALLGTDTTRLHWHREDALPFDVRLERAFVSANIVPVVSGLTYVERFTIGPNSAGLTTAIEREGPLSANEGTRPVIYRVPMPRTVTDGLAWRPAEGDMPWDRRYAPDVALIRTDATGVPQEDWRVVTDLLEEGPTDEAATVEAGHWGPVFNWLDNGQPRSHRDYIGDPGWCLRFGTDGFGLAPADGSFFTLRYRTAWTHFANLPPDRMHLVADPTTTPFNLAMPTAILSAWNPFAFDNAQPPEPLALAKVTVPHAAQAIKLRAVRDRDYEELVSARDDIEAVVAHSYWLGTWTGTFLATDPMDSVTLDPDQRDELTRFIEEIRLVGRPAYLTDAALRPLDLQIVICCDPRVPYGHAVQAILDALVGDNPEALFHPDNLSFGSRLYRAALEGRIAAQQCVTRILRIRYRWRGERDFRDFTESFLDSAPDQIPVVRHDPMRPDLGRVEIFDTFLPDETAP